MNEQLEARLLKYKTIKKNINEQEDGYSFNANVGNHRQCDAVYQKLEGHYLIILEKSGSIIDALSIVHTSEEAKNACYQELLKYAYKNFKIDGDLIMGKDIFAYRNDEGTVA